MSKKEGFLLPRPYLVSRRIFVSGSLAAAASVALPVLRAQPHPETRKIVVSVGGKPAFYYLPLTISDQLGYFKAEGLEVEINDLVDSAGALRAVSDGSADVCSGAFEHTINLQARNHLFQAFVLQGRAPQIAFGVSSKNMPDFKSFADLRGRKIGISAPEASTRLMVNMMLSRGGLRAADVSFVGVGAAAGALEALRLGRIDAISSTDPVMTLLEQAGDVKIIGDTRSLKGTMEVFGGPMPAACLYAPIDFIRKNPNTCQALANAIVHGLKWLQTAEPGDIVKTVPEHYLLGDRALYLAAFNKVRESISPDGLIPEEGPQTALKALASFDAAIRPDRIDLGKTYTNLFAQRAKDRFKA